MIKKVIIRSEEDLTPNMISFGYNCLNKFLRDLKAQTYGKDWNDCAYTNIHEGLAAWVKVNKNRTISIVVYKEYTK